MKDKKGDFFHKKKTTTVCNHFNILGKTRSGEENLRENYGKIFESFIHHYKTYYIIWNHTLLGTLFISYKSLLEKICIPRFNMNQPIFL